MTRGSARIVLSLVAALALGCGGEDPPAPSVADGLKATIGTMLRRFSESLVTLRARAPRGREWQPSGADADAVKAMRAAWLDAHAAFVGLAGPVGELFPEQIPGLDRRWDVQLTDLGVDPDFMPFDERGVTGLHAIERILWSDQISSAVSSYEMTRLGYRTPRFPGTAEEADAFVASLAGAVAQVGLEVNQQFSRLTPDAALGAAGISRLLANSFLKVDLGYVAGSEDSRYSGTTMLDLRSELAAARAIWNVLRDGLSRRGAASEKLGGVDAGLARWTALLDEVKSKDFPVAPNLWDPGTPSPEHALTPYGMLFVGLRRELNKARPDSLVSALREALGSARSKDEAPKEQGGHRA